MASSAQHADSRVPIRRRLTAGSSARASWIQPQSPTTHSTRASLIVTGAAVAPEGVRVCVSVSESPFR